jgi:signal peptide peptidase SppA
MDDLLSLPRFARADEYAALWLIEPAAARQMWEHARHLDMAAHVAAGQIEPPALLAAQAVQAAGGKQVAVIPVTGVLMKGRSSMGGTSTVEIRRAVRTAAADPAVSGILLNIDSPGGTVSGTEELAAEVKRAAGRKPVFAQVEDMAASAAYWVASQATRVFANAQTALVGSIGTYLTVYDASGAAERQGVKVLHFATGPLKGAGTMGTQITDEQRAYFQGMVDGSQAEFDRAVRSGRGLSAAGLAAVRTGAVWKAAEAQALGLIDGIQGVGKTIEQLTRAAEPAVSRGRSGAALPVIVRGALPTLRGVIE